MENRQTEAESRQTEAENRKTKVENRQYDFGGKTILLAEDTKLSAEITRDLLELVHLKTLWARDGKMAVRMFANSAPGELAAVLMDIHMPEMSGYEAARALRSMERPDAAEVPIFAMTADVFEEDIKKFREAGMNEYMVKPVESDQLYGLLAKFLQK